MQFLGKPSNNIVLFLKKKYRPYIVYIVVTSNEGGTTFGSGIYKKNSTVEIKAIPNIGFKFIKWNDGNESSIRKITAKTDKTYIAEFEFDESIGILNYKENY